MSPDITQPTCSRCGVETTSKFGDVFICDECYIIRGSCCPEFEPNDLSADDDKPAP